MASADAVLSALGPRGAKSPDLLATAARNVVQAMGKTGARRLIGVSAAGAFIQDDAQAGGLVKLILPRIFARSFADVRAMEQVVQASDLDWTLVRPTRLVNVPGRGSWRVRDQYPPPGLTKIARADVAQFIIARPDRVQLPSTSPPRSAGSSRSSLRDHDFGPNLLNPKS